MSLDRSYCLGCGVGSSAMIFFLMSTDRIWMEVGSLNSWTNCLIELEIDRNQGEDEVNSKKEPETQQSF
jgi:hypothetical protein